MKAIKIVAKICLSIKPIAVTKKMNFKRAYQLSVANFHRSRIVEGHKISITGN